MPSTIPFDTQTTRTSLRLRADVLKAADRLAAFNGVTRSDILRTAIIELLEKHNIIRSEHRADQP